ncbi:hypothetical protein LHEH8_03200 [Lactobacillus helveticus]|uniref:Amino acid permease/ SLC12A domain-containing protein n=1 Tax=Lactobacillus helveticus TaxID=1587 RepID=A0A8H9F6S8_LACHE|nr:amino acid permease [Lactobacillus helveticus]GFO98564.1 hypothetical protein LHEH8_03200 [Lactobacillus helveticus]GFP00504.1 hypothetical protein LHEW6_03370 [Lactobacillus helveticus]GFP03690.1 hypothetical protein LHEY10_16190 [Lactobacillus helveticus]GFP04925.1 hypothetical protein LMG22465_09380 [Lactobacillus helveticus]
MADKHPNNNLKLSIGFGSAISIVIGTIIGSGLFFKQASVLDSAGSSTMAIIAWIFGGLITLTGRLTIAEIGAQMLYTGGLYVYIENLYGRICGFMAGWMQIIVYGPAIIASVAGFMSILMANFYRNGWFPNGFSGVFTTMLTVNFAFSGTELIGVTAGEAENPQKAIPSAIKTTLWRLLIFFIGSIAVMSALIPYMVAGVTQSPFVYDSIHVPFAANIMNFVVLTAIISAANSGLYASTRMLWSLSNEGTIPTIFKKTNKNGIPVLALIFSMLGGVFALVSSKIAADTVYLVLVSISGLAVVFSFGWQSLG